MFNFGFNFGKPSSGSTTLAQILYDMNITDVDGTDYLLNQGASGSNDAIVLNATQDGAGSILVDGTTDIDTGFKPNIATYSIEETVTGDLAELGAEIVINGTFDSNINGFSTNAGTILWESGEAKVSLTTVGGFTRTLNLDQFLSALPAGNYIWSFDFRIETGSQTVEALPYDSANAFHSLGFVGDGSYSFELSNASDMLYLRIYTVGSQIGDVYYFDNISIKEVSTSQRTEQRLLTHDSVNGDKYYINGIEQSEVPALPDSATNINLGNTAIIGYPDSIDSREANFEVWDTVKTAADALDSYNQWVLDYQDVLTDGNGDPLTDGDGRFLYV